MRHITDIVIHCTATREGVHVSAETIDRWHREKGWRGIGYHFVVGLDGDLEMGRSENEVGAHVKGFNRRSIGVVYVGGLDRFLRPKDTRTQAQKDSLLCLLQDLRQKYPEAKISGHRDFSPDRNGNGIIEPFEWTKHCPCFDAKEEYMHL